MLHTAAQQAPHAWPLKPTKPLPLRQRQQQRYRWGGPRGRAGPSRRHGPKQEQMRVSRRGGTSLPCEQTGL